MVQSRRNTVLAAVIGTVLASYAGSAPAMEFQLENGATINWNTTLSVGASWRAEAPNRQLYTRTDGSLIGLWSGVPLLPGQATGPGDGLAGNQAAGDGNLNYAQGDRFSTPFRLITDVEFKKGNFGALLRLKAWYDESLNDEEVRVGHQANNFNGTRPALGPTSPPLTLCPPGTASAGCLPFSLPGQNVWPRAKLSDDGFEDEQKFDNVYLLDAYVYGSFAVGDSDLQFRLGNQVINWGESVFIQGVNQINPIDVPAARRAGAELKEILLPVWAVYANWGFSFGSLEAFYQLQWNNTSVDGCGTYWTVSGTLISSDPGKCRSITVLGLQNGAPFIPGQPQIPQAGSQPYLQGTGVYLPSVDGKDASDSGQFGLAFRVPVDAIDTEIGFYAMNIHARLPNSSGYSGTNAGDFLASLPPPLAGALTQLGYIGVDEWGGFWRPTGLTGTRYRTLFPAIETAFERQVLPAFGLTNVDLQSGAGFWEYPEDIQVYGISAATNLFSASVSAELSYSVDVPAQVNGNDLILATISGLGAASERLRAVAAQPAGSYSAGFDRFDKTQFQVNVVKNFSNVLGAENLLFVGEVGSQWNNVPDYKDGSLRYGRGFMFGTGSTPAFVTSGPEGQPGFGAASGGNLCLPYMQNFSVAPNSQYNAQPNGCTNDGYITDFAWGYRLRVSMDYNNVGDSGVTVTPSVFWSHDVDGVSIDPAFIEDRQTLGLGLKFNYNKKYTVDLNYVNYGDENFDPLFDRDYYSAAVSVTF